MTTISFFGHRNLWGRDIKDRLYNEVAKFVQTNEEISFLIGTHGEFDSLTLSVARELRKIYHNIKITVVFTTLTILRRDSETEYSIADYYDDVETMIYDIEDEHFKNRIIASNRRMVDDSDIVICYVDMQEYQSGAKRAVKYAIKQNKQVINIFKDSDRPFYGMSKEEILKEWEK